MMQALWLQPSQRQVVQWPNQALEGEGVLWLDIQGATPAEMEQVAKAFNLHPAVVRACLNPEHRAKLKEYAGHLLLVLGALGRGTSEGKPADSLPELRRWRTYELDIIVTARAVITVHPEPVPAVAALWQRMLKAGEGRPALDYIVYALAESVTTGYFTLLDRIDRYIDGLEEQIFAGETDQELVDRLFTLKRHILQLRRTLAPQRDALSALMRREFGLFGAESRSYFVDLYEHNLRLFDLLDTYRDLISSSLDAYLSAVSNKMNEVMKTLTIVSVVMLPLSVISGIFGMNFVRIPLIESPYGFWVAMGLMLVVSVVMLWLFRRRKWM